MLKKELKLNLKRALRKDFNKRKLAKRLKILTERNEKFLAEPEIDREGLHIRMEV